MATFNTKRGPTLGQPRPTTPKRHYPIPAEKPAEPSLPYCYLSRGTSEGYGDFEDNLGYAGHRYGRLTAIARSPLPDRNEDYLPGITQRRPTCRKPWPRWRDRDVEMHNFIDLKLYGGWHPLALIAVAQPELFYLDVGAKGWRGKEAAALVAVLRHLDYLYQKGRFDFLQPLSMLRELERGSIEYGLFRASMRHRFLPKDLYAEPPARLLKFAAKLDYYERMMENPHPGIPCLHSEQRAAGFIEQAMTTLPSYHPLHFAPEHMWHPRLTFREIKTNNSKPRLIPKQPRKARQGYQGSRDSSVSSEDLNIRSMPKVREEPRHRTLQRYAESTGMAANAQQFTQRVATTSPEENWGWISRNGKGRAMDAAVEDVSSNTPGTLNSSLIPGRSPTTTGPTNVTNSASGSPPKQADLQTALDLPSYAPQQDAPVEALNQQQGFDIFTEDDPEYQPTSIHQSLPSLSRCTTAYQKTTSSHRVQAPHVNSPESQPLQPILGTTQANFAAPLTPTIFTAETQHNVFNYSVMLPQKQQTIQAMTEKQQADWRDIAKIWSLSPLAAQGSSSQVQQLDHESPRQNWTYCPIQIPEWLQKEADDIRSSMREASFISAGPKASDQEPLDMSHEVPEPTFPLKADETTRQAQQSCSKPAAPSTAEHALPPLRGSRPTMTSEVQERLDEDGYAITMRTSMS